MERKPMPTYSKFGKPKASVPVNSRVPMNNARGM